MKNRTKLICILFFLLVIGCQNRVQESKRVVSLNPLISSDTIVPGEQNSIEELEATLSQATYEVTHIDAKPTLTDASSEYSSACSGWRVSAGEAVEIFKLSKLISGSEMHDLYYDLPCRLKGTLLINREEYRFIMNAGSFTFVFRDENRFYLGCADNACKPFFIVQGGNLERDVPKE